MLRLKRYRIFPFPSIISLSLIVFLSFTAADTTTSSSSTMVTTTIPPSKITNNEIDSEKPNAELKYTEFQTVQSEICPSVYCSSPPKDGSLCRISTSTLVNPVLPMLGSQVDCCPVHVCVRKDHTTFTHYGLVSEGMAGSADTFAGGMDLKLLSQPHGNIYSEVFPSYSQVHFFPQLPSVPEMDNSQDKRQFRGSYPNHGQFIQSQHQQQQPMMNIYPNNYGQQENNRINRNGQFIGPNSISQPQQDAVQMNWELYERSRRNAMPMSQPQFMGQPAGSPYELFG